MNICSECGDHIIKCVICGVPLAGGSLCWICEVEKDGRPVYVAMSTSKGSILAYWHEGEGIDGDWPKIKAEEFCLIVRAQIKKGRL